MPLIIYTVVLVFLILLLGFSMNFGLDWIKLLIVFFIIAVVSGPFELAFMKELIRKSQEKIIRRSQEKKGIND